MIIPERHNEDHSLLEGVTHDLKTTELLEAVGVVEDGLLSVTEVVGDRVVARDTGNGGDGVLDDLAVLNVDAADLSEVTGLGAVGSEELGNDGDGLGGVDGETGAEEGLVAHAEGVEVASVLVAESVVAVVGAVTAVVASAGSLLSDGADVRGEGLAHGVTLPDVHLRAARAGRTSAGVSAVGRRSPALNVSLVHNDM